MDTPAQRASAADRMLLAAIRLFSGRRTARLALRFSRRAYAEHTANDVRRRTRFLARTLWYCRTSSHWYGFLDANTTLRGMPELAEKLHRPYARKGLGANARLAALISHYRTCGDLRWTPLLDALVRGPVVLASWRDKTDQPLTLTLDRPHQFAKEGELALNLEREGERLGTVAFSLRDGAKHVIDVGCLQGPAGEEGRQQVRDLTRGCHGLRPKVLLVEALRAIATVSGSQMIVAVGNRHHIYRSMRKRRSISFDYDEFWRELGGSPRRDGDWSLAVTTANRPIEDVPSRKRAEATRRRALVEDIQRQIAATLLAARGAPSDRDTARAPIGFMQAILEVDAALHA
jgi:uncharacterized protein VirK/YbjX